MPKIKRYIWLFGGVFIAVTVLYWLLSYPFFKSDLSLIPGSDVHFLTNMLGRTIVKYGGNSSTRETTLFLFDRDEGDNPVKLERLDSRHVKVVFSYADQKRKFRSEFLDSLCGYSKQKTPPNMDIDKNISIDNNWISELNRVSVDGKVLFYYTTGACWGGVPIEIKQNGKWIEAIFFLRE